MSTNPLTPRPDRRALARLERAWPRCSQQRFRVISFGLWTSCSALLIVTPTYDLTLSVPALMGGALLGFGLWAEQVLIALYHNQFYFRGLSSVIASAGKPSDPYSYEVEVVMATSADDLTAGTLTSDLGIHIYVSAGLTEPMVNEFLASERPHLKASALPIFHDRTCTLADVIDYLVSHDTALNALLTNHGITTETFRAAAAWRVNHASSTKRRLRFWSRDSLSTTRGIGYYLLPSPTWPQASYITPVSHTKGKTLLSPSLRDTIEGHLARSKTTNLLLLGDTDYTTDCIEGVAARFHYGAALNALSFQQLYWLDVLALLRDSADHIEAEERLCAIFDQAAYLGHTTIVIAHIAETLETAERLGLNLTAVFDLYLALPGLHIIALETKTKFKTIAAYDQFLKRFELIPCERTTVGFYLEALLATAPAIETRTGATFTYPALRALATSLAAESASDSEARITTELTKLATRLIQTKTETVITPRYVNGALQNQSGGTGASVDLKQERPEDVLLSTIETTYPKERKVLAQLTLAIQTRETKPDTRPLYTFLQAGDATLCTDFITTLTTSFKRPVHTIDLTTFTRASMVSYLIGDENGIGTLTDILKKSEMSIIVITGIETAHVSIKKWLEEMIQTGGFQSRHSGWIHSTKSIVVVNTTHTNDLITRTRQTRNTAPVLDRHITERLTTTLQLTTPLASSFDAILIWEGE
jgi:hypothetical protein